jgi:ELWxxDGT repeat protein
MLRPLLPLLCLVVGISQAQELVKDINPLKGGQVASTTDFAQLCIPCGGFVYFPARDKEHGRELWRTDGTPAGTIRLTDIKPGSEDGLRQEVAIGSVSACLNGHFYYGDAPLTKTDGTPEGTETIIFNTGYGLVAFDNTVTYTREASLLQTTGDANNETVLKEFVANPGAIGVAVTSLKSSGGKLFVEVAHIMSPDPDIHEIWAFEEGNATGTMVYSTDKFINRRETAGGYYYFRGYDDDHGYETWVSDGTPAGTMMLVDTNPGPDPSGQFDVMIPLDDKLILGSQTPTQITWVSSGTPATTTAIANDFYPYYITKFHDKVYMSAYGAGGWQLGRTDADFTNFEIIVPNAGSSLSGLLTVAGDKLLYSFEDPTNGVELYSVDEVTGDLELIKDINAGNNGSNPRSFAELGDLSVFVAEDADHGFEFWVTDGSDTGTTILDDISKGTATSEITDVYQYNKKLYFLARSSGSLKREMWTSDGTDPGTRFLYDPANSYPGALIAANQNVIMDDNGGFVKIDTDTEDDITLNFPNGESIIGLVTAQPWLTIGNTAFFYTMTDAGVGAELWTADLTTNDISFVKDINPGQGGSSVYGERPKNNDMGVTLNDKIIFPAQCPEGVEPWVSDGTEEGTMLLADIAEFAFDYPTNFTVMGDNVYFLAKSHNEGREIWVTDGTPEGTHILKDIAPGSASGIIEANLTVYNGTLFFSATTTGNTPNSLWTSDGTEEGTVPFDILPNGWSNINSVTSSGNYFFFNATHPAHGQELWISDGTPGGTVMLELEPGPAGSSAGHFVNDNGKLYFTSNGKIWRTQGDLLSTVILGEAEIASDLFVTDSYLCFLVDSDDYGKELYRLDLNAPAGQLIVFTGFIDLQPGQEYDISVDASSGLPVMLDSSDPSIIEVSGNTIIVHKAGSVTFTATQGGDVNFKPATSTLDVTIDLIPQTITFEEFPAKFINDPVFSPDASTNSPLSLTFESSDNAIAEIDVNGVITIKKAGTVTITARQEGDDSYAAADPVTRTLTISKLVQTITLNDIPAKKVGDAPFTVEASTTSGLPLTFGSSDVAIAAISSTGEITIKKSGDVMITVSQAGDDTYAAASIVSKTLSITKTTQFITFEDISTKTFGGAPFAIAGVSSAGLDVVFNSTSDKITINGSNVTMNAAGKVTITANQPGNDIYGPAEQVSKTFCINPKKPTVTMTTAGAEITLTSSETNNVWQRNNTPITFTGKSFKATQDGVYKAAGLADDCQGEFSEVVNVVIVGLEDEISALEVYPNPVGETLYVKIATATGQRGLRKIRITDLQGREVHKESMADEASIDVSSFVPGMYIVTLQDAESTRSIKLVKR